MSELRKPGKNRALVALAAVVALAFVLVFGMAVFQKARAVSQDTYEYLELFNQVLSIVDRDYVKDVSVKDLVYGAIDGMLASLDPHTVFMPVEDYNEMREDISGEFGGLGIEVGMREGILTVISPIEDTPAWHAGIQAGDIITHIDGEPTKDLRLREAVHRMRGPVGTTVTITIEREGLEKPRDITVRRELIKIKSIKAVELYDGKIGYVKIITFTEFTSKELREAYDTLREQAGGELAGLILDFRNNPGGPLDQAIKVSDMFLSEGQIVSVKGRRQESSPAYAHKAGTVTGLPLVVLINNHTASASEIVSGALQDHGRAVVMGIPSFGKGSVQQLRTLKGGAGLKITTAYYYVPSGRVIQENGIIPDVVVSEFSPEQWKEREEQGEAERRYFRERDLQRHFKHEEEKTYEELEPNEDLLPKTVGTDTEDYQLQRALDLLRSPRDFLAALQK